MTFHDVIRHLVSLAHFVSDEERDAALAAVDDHEAATVPAAAAAPAEENPGTPGATASYAMPAGSDYHPDPQ